MLSRAAFAAEKARVKEALAAGLLDPDEATEQISHLLKRATLDDDGGRNIGEVCKATRAAIGELKSRKMGKKLARACWERRPNDAIRLIKEGADVEGDGDERKPLHSACYFIGMEAVAALLIEAGANVNAIDSSGQTPLFAAAYSGHLETTKLLLMHMDKTSLNVVHCDQTALDFALKDDEFDDDGDRRDHELFSQVAAAIRLRGGLTAAELLK
jgi:hypothetical protein